MLPKPHFNTVALNTSRCIHLFFIHSNWLLKHLIYWIRWLFNRFTEDSFYLTINLRILESFHFFKVKAANY